MGAFSKSVSAVTILFALATAPAHANLITNFSFETPDASGGSGVILLNPGDTSLTGWTITGGSGINVIHNSAGIGNASQGTQFIDLNGTDAGSVLSQTFATVAGQDYELWLSFTNNSGPVGAGPRDALAIMELLDGVTSTSLAVPGLLSDSSTSGGSNSWITVGQLFTAIGSTTRVEFTGINFGDDAGILIDNVSVTAVGVTAVPEPGSLALVGIAALWGLGRRLRRPPALEARP